MRPIAPSLAAALVLAGCTEEVLVQPVVSADIVASEGGEVVHPSGAVLRIPAGALSADATVRIRDGGLHPSDPTADRDPLVSWSSRFGIDLGGADLDEPVSLGIEPPVLLGGDVDDADLDDHLVLVAVGADGMRRVTGVAADDDPDLGYLVGEVWDGMLPDLAVDPEGFHDLELQWVPPPLFVLDDGVLDAPFYSQDGLQWCELTSIAMLYNYHASTPVGLTSPWHLAAEYDTPADVSGVPPDGVLEASGGLKYARGIYWNAELIPSAPFTDYVKGVVGGHATVTTVQGIDDGVLGVSVWATPDEVAPRPVQTTSSTGGGLHGYLITGVSDDGLRVHDSSGALTGVHGLAGELSWDAYRDTVAKAGDKDIWTAVLELPVRPAEERRGSLVLRGGFDPGSSFAFTPAVGSTRKWLWDGEEPHTYGYYWGFDVGACDDPTGDLGCNFDGLDGVLRGDLDYRFHVANVTASPRDYRVDLTLWRSGGGGVVMDAVHLVEDAPPLEWAANVVEGTLSLDGIDQEGRYELYVVLRADDVVQDVKTVRFEVRL